MVDLRIPKITINPKPQRKKISSKAKEVIRKGYGNKCPKCGRRINQYNSEIHHTKGNPSSRDVQGLKPYCNQCHREENAKQARKRAKIKREGSIGKPIKSLKLPKVKI